MILQTEPVRTTQASLPTGWGLTPEQVHDRYWAARGVHVVRQGELAEIPDEAELYLLTGPRTLVMFRVRRFLELLSWAKPDVLYVRIRNQRDHGYRESAVTDEDGQFVRFKRSYGSSDSRLARVAFTADPGLARLWQLAPDARTAWRQVREHSSRKKREARSITARVYDATTDDDVAAFVRDVIQHWKHPDTIIPGLRKVAAGVFAAEGTRVDPGVTFAGPLWIGAGRHVERPLSLIGPGALWDDPESRPAATLPRWGDIEPLPAYVPRADAAFQRSRIYPHLKRAFDIVFALFVLALTLPIYPLVMLAIWLEDGRPFFFAHKRETVGGRTFGCLKFRSMRKDADKIKAALAKANQSDGPQFFIAADPRISRVGRLLRKTNLDELPQFINVLRGDMSVIGPRPSPYVENQYCPPWREARLSVRPGVTGLWQVNRTRAPGLDFQEWIRFDLEYVEKMGWRLDCWILWKTFLVLLRGVFRS